MVFKLKRIVMPCVGKGETEVESDIVSWCSRIQVCLLSKPVNIVLNILRSVSGRDESTSFQCSFSEQICLLKLKWHCLENDNLCCHLPVEVLLCQKPLAPLLCFGSASAKPVTLLWWGWGIWVLCPEQRSLYWHQPCAQNCIITW